MVLHCMGHHHAEWRGPDLPMRPISRERQHDLEARGHSRRLGGDDDLGLGPSDVPSHRARRDVSSPSETSGVQNDRESQHDLSLADYRQLVNRARYGPSFVLLVLG